MIEKCPECGIEKTEENIRHKKYGIVLSTHNGDIYPDIRIYYCENCGHSYDIDYEKQEYKMKHKHAELMMQYAQDAMETDKPWERWEVFIKDSWRDLGECFFFAKCRIIFLQKV